MVCFWRWLRELDLNQRPSGYEPDELPGCSIPRYRGVKTPKGLPFWVSPVDFVNGLYRLPLVAMPGDDLLFQRLSVSTIGAVWFHGRVRDGIGWVTDAMATKQWDQWMRVLNRCALMGMSGFRRIWLEYSPPTCRAEAGLSLTVRILKRDMNY